MRASIAVMGLPVFALSTRGALTRGRSSSWRAGTAAFGLHGIYHLAASAIRREYTPGVVTAVVLVLPHSIDLERRSRREYGAPSARIRLLACALLPSLLVFSHGAAKVMENSKSEELPCWR